MASYEDAIKSYLSRANSRRSASRSSVADMLMATSNPVTSAASVGGSAKYNPAGSKVGSNFEKFLQSIAKQESGGNYGAVNKSSGALGKYQIMPSNIASWSKEALGRSITPQKFLRSPKLQEAVAQAKLRYYFNKYGASGAAKAWYGGEGAARRSSNAPQGAYPSINAYADSVVRRTR